LETQPTETEGKQEKKKIGKTNDGKELEMENRKFICFVPLFSSALILLIFTLLNRFPFFLKDFFMEALFTARN